MIWIRQKLLRNHLQIPWVHLLKNFMPEWLLFHVELNWIFIQNIDGDDITKRHHQTSINVFTPWAHRRMYLNVVRNYVWLILTNGGIEVRFTCRIIFQQLAQLTLRLINKQRLFNRLKSFTSYTCYLVTSLLVYTNSREDAKKFHFQYIVWDLNNLIDPKLRRHHVSCLCLAVIVFVWSVRALVSWLHNQLFVYW